MTSRRRTAGRPVVLVTGGHGAIGSWAVRALRERHARVVVFDVSPEPVVELDRGQADVVVVGDLRDTGLLETVVRDHDVTGILHLAALVGEACEQQPALAIEINALATARLLEIARSASLHRVVAMSTKGVLGALEARHLHPRYEPVPTDAPTGPRSMYETTKLVVERLVAAERALGADAIAVRLATTWGPGKSRATHAGFSLHSDVVAAALAGESSVLDVHPEQGYDLVYYADVGAGLADAVLAGGPLASAVYHLGSGAITRMGEFASAVEAAFPGVRVGLGDRFPSGRNCLLDIGPARADLGYEPRYDVAAGLADFVRRSRPAEADAAAVS